MKSGKTVRESGKSQGNSLWDPGRHPVQNKTQSSFYASTLKNYIKTCTVGKQLTVAFKHSSW